MTELNCLHSDFQSHDYSYISTSYSFSCGHIPISGGEDVDKASTILDPSINTGTIIMAKTEYSYKVVGKTVRAAGSFGQPRPDLTGSLQFVYLVSRSKWINIRLVLIKPQRIFRNLLGKVAFRPMGHKFVQY
jgi:hypothetical protein